MVLSIITTLNLLAGGAVALPAKEVRTHSVTSGEAKSKTQCSNGLDVPGLCDPICASIFNEKMTDEETRKQIDRIFREVMDCDHVCTCICDGICDAFMM